MDRTGGQGSLLRRWVSLIQPPAYLELGYIGLHRPAIALTAPRRECQQARHAAADDCGARRRRSEAGGYGGCDRCGLYGSGEAGWRVLAAGGERARRGASRGDGARGRSELQRRHRIVSDRRRHRRDGCVGDGRRAPHRSRRCSHHHGAQPDPIGAGGARRRPPRPAEWSRGGGVCAALRSADRAAGMVHHAAPAPTLGGAARDGRRHGRGRRGRLQRTRRSGDLDRRPARQAAGAHRRLRHSRRRNVRR